MEKEVKLMVDEEFWQRAKVAAATANVSLKYLCTTAIRREFQAIEDGFRYESQASDH